MAYNNNHHQVPFWDFVRSFDHQNGAGVDHPAPNFSFFGPPPPPPGLPHDRHGAGFPFGAFGFGGRGGFGGPGGRGGHGPRGGHFERGRHGHGRNRDEAGEAHESRDNSPHTVDNSGGEAPAEGHGPRGFGRHGRHGRHGHRGEHSEGEAGEEGHGRRGPRCFGHHGRGRHQRGWGHHGRRGPPAPPAPPGVPPYPFAFNRAAGQGGPGAFDMSALIESLSAHPLAQAFRQYAEQAGFGVGAQRSGETLVPDDADAEDTFVPPIDVFSAEKQYVLHVSLPGAKKEDVGVNWDEEKGVLNLAGVVYRQGDEEFLQTLAQSERKVGMFERSIRLPPNEEEKEEIDGDAISAKLEDGVLIVTVPKVEKEWTEVDVKKINIE